MSAPKLRPGWENEPAEPPVPWRMAAAVVVLTVLCSWLLSGCGGGGDDDCRADLMGPPAPALQHLPVCPGDGRAVVPRPNCTTNPERCS